MASPFTKALIFKNTNQLFVCVGQHVSFQTLYVQLVLFFTKREMSVEKRHKTHSRVLYITFVYKIKTHLTPGM